MADTHARSHLDSRQLLAASIHRVLRAEIPAPAAADELLTSIDSALLDEAQRNELTLAYLRLGAMASAVVALAIDAALRRTNFLDGSAGSAAPLMAILGLVWLGATGAIVVALRRGWYRTWLRRATPVGDAVMIVVAAELFGGPTHASIAGAALAATIGALLAASGALRLTPTAVHLSTALAVAGVVVAAVVVRWPPVDAGVVVLPVLFGGALGIVVMRLVRRAVTNQVGRTTMSRLYGEAQQVIDARAEVLRVVSHDLRNPLSTIMMGTSSLLESSPSELQTRQLRIIRRAGERMNRLIQDLLSVSIIEAGRLSIDPTVFDVRTLVDEAVETLGPLAREKSIQLDAVLSPDLPVVRADAARMLQVISNLVGNAIKFTPADGRITLAAVAAEGGVRCDVIDTGPGIPEELLPKIFGRFWQQTRGDRRGIGLGLSIAKGIIEAHGQRLWVTSRVGEGSIFSFTLPAA